MVLFQHSSAGLMLSYAKGGVVQCARRGQRPSTNLTRSNLMPHSMAPRTCFSRDPGIAHLEDCTTGDCTLKYRWTVP